ncbi:MAG: DUF3455 domain-containing protein [Xenococcaceae cyanobacterium]
MSKTKINLLLFVGIYSIGLPLFLSFIPPRPGIAQQNSCQVKENDRKLPSSIPASSLNASIDWAMKEANLQGEVKFIVWADGVQIYNYSNGQPKIFAPLANLYPVENFDDEMYILMNDPIGNHYKIGDAPAWEFLGGNRLVAKSKKEIEGAGEKDAPWLAVKIKPVTDKTDATLKIEPKDYYILRLETRGGTAPDCPRQFEGFLSVDYQTLYAIVKVNSQQQSVLNR